MLCLALNGCATYLQHAVTPNRANLLKLSIGMSKEEALRVMGTETFSAGGVDLFAGNKGQAVIITNPYRSEILQGKDKTFEVLYYVTDDKGFRGAITDDDLTPLVFDNGKLIGWGRSFLQDNAQKYEKLQHQYEKIKELLAQQSDFIKVAAHEFRTPLNIALFQLADTLESYKLVPEVLANMKTVGKFLQKKTEHLQI